MTETECNALEEVREILAQLKEYTVEKILGAGAMGYVVQVRNRVIGLRAIKLVHPRLLRSPVIRTRFDNEARIMSSLRHVNVVQVLDMGTAGNNYPYILMEFLEGGTLEDRLTRRGVMPPRQAVRVIIAILRGLQVAHDKGIVHRDIKPQNILFDRDGTPKITDFGIARVEEGTRSMTREGAAMGTFAYMPPEQLDGEHSKVDARADVHAVGVTLYVMLTCGELGQRAFHTQIENHPERLDPIPLILQAVIRKATAQKKDDRYSSAEVMADELERLIADLPDDPPETPTVGSELEEGSDSEVTDEVAIAPIGGGTMVPGHAQGGELSVSGITGAIVPVQVPPVIVHGTWSDPGAGNQDDHPHVGTLLQEDLEVQPDRRDVEGVKKRWVVLPVVGLLLALVSGAGAWFATRPEPVVEVEQAVNVEPVVEAVPESVVESAVEAVVESQPVEAQTVPVSEPAKQPAKQPAKVVKDSQTPMKVVVKLPPPEAVVTVEERAQVRLILVNDTVATLTLSGEGGTFTLMGGSRDVPQGTYHVSVEMPVRETPQTGTLTVTPGLTVVKCDSRFKKCVGFK